MNLPDIATIEARLPLLRSVRPIAQGGQKLVYRALHETHGEVVLKLILDAGANERSMREIEVATTCRFTNVPCLFESGTIDHEGGTTLYLIEEFVAGETLRERLGRDGQLPVSTVLRLIDALLQAAVELEQQGLVHRDIKPENIVVDLSDSFWLLDFGIARHLGKTSITATAAHFGPHTAGYSAPEQFRNVKIHIDIRADLFSIGVIAYETLTGQHPFITGARDYIDVLRRTELANPASLVIPGDINGDLSSFVQTLMDKYPSRRPPTAATAQEWFRGLLPNIVSH